MALSAPPTGGAAEPAPTVTVSETVTTTATATTTATQHVTTTATATTTTTAATTTTVTTAAAPGSTVTTTVTATDPVTATVVGTNTATATQTATRTATATQAVTPPPATTTVTTTAFTSPPPGDVYDTPGKHKSGGRDWMTVCEPYSATVRCWTHIWGTQVLHENGKFREHTGWIFNNLTYVASPRALWEDNPLGNPGSWNDDAGRAWRTECDTARTGRDGCRTWVTIRVAERAPGGGYRFVTTEVFNNMVRFG